ncbi:MAG TPA: hypothetical protein PLG59_13415 [bacterium]|nr:hypothetical protein [bacterium]HQO35658.1 hypothetical protein [bacterium]HQQ00488.1 hypothetical protein [bacterium]
MRMYRKALLGIACLLGIGLLAGVAVSQDASTTEKPDRITLQIQRMTRTLELTEAQQNMVRVILEEKQPKIDALEEQIKQIRKEMDDAVTNVLTDEQKAKREKMETARRARGEGAGAGAGFQGARRGEGAGPQGAAPMRALEQLNLTDEQKAKIDEIMKNRPQNMREEIMKVLTEEQKEQWEKMRSQAAERGRGAGPQGEGRGGRGGRGAGGGGGRAAQE